MFKKIGGTEDQIGYVSKCGLVTAMCSDGFEDIVSFQVRRSSYKEGCDLLAECGYEQISE